MGEAVAPSTSTVIYEDKRSLSFPAISSAGGRSGGRLGEWFSWDLQAIRESRQLHPVLPQN
jgi:hypothetical protein